MRLSFVFFLSLIICLLDFISFFRYSIKKNKRKIFNLNIIDEIYRKIVVDKHWTINSYHQKISKPKNKI